MILETRFPRIPPSAVARLAALAERQSEGRFERSSARRTYFGSTYFTFPLGRVRAAFAGRRVREMGAADLARTLGNQPLLRLRLLRLAREEAERRIAGDGGRGRSGAGAAAPTRAAGTRGGADDVAPGTARITSVVSSDSEAVVFEIGVEIPCVPAGSGGGADGGGEAEGSR
jgi:hypothetical protein